VQLLAVLHSPCLLLICFCVFIVIEQWDDLSVLCKTCRNSSSQSKAFTSSVAFALRHSSLYFLVLPRHENAPLRKNNIRLTRSECRVCIFNFSFIYIKSLSEEEASCHVSIFLVTPRSIKAGQWPVVRSMGHRMCQACRSLKTFARPVGESSVRFFFNRSPCMINVCGQSWMLSLWRYAAREELRIHLLFISHKVMSLFFVYFACA
jgi:hypothetical protein